MKVPSRVYADPSAIGLSDEQIEQIRSRLYGLIEREFTPRFLVPYFERRGYEIENIDNLDEKRHGLDLLLISRMDDGSISSIHGVQVKREDYGTHGVVQKKIGRELKRIFETPHTVEGKDYYISKLYWMTNRRVKRDAETGFKELAKLWKREMELWSGSMFVRDVLERGWYDLLEEWQLLQFQAAKQQHKDQREGVFAAHCAYRTALWYLQGGSSSLDAARGCLREAVDLINRDKRKSLYYYRALRTYYDMLDDLLGHLPYLSVAELTGMEGTSRPPEAEEYIHRRYPGWGCHFLNAMAFFFDQLELLEERYLDPRSGLSSLEVCRLLLRAGRSPAIGSSRGTHLAPSPIAKRLAAIVEEMDRQAAKMAERGRKSGHASLDDECSICTGTGVACLALTHQRVQCKPLVKWLETLRKFRFVHQFHSYYDAEPGEHALHYAAAVMEGFQSYSRGITNRRTNQVLTVLLDRLDPGTSAFPAEWMRFRNIDRFDVCSYIFSAFVMLSLSGQSFEPENEAALQRTLKTLSAELVNEALATDMPRLHKPAKLYAVRKNVGSLSLAVLLGVEDPHIELLLKDAIRHFHWRARVVLTNRWQGRDLFSQHLMDSDVDRTRSLLEAWMQFWEVFHLCRERGDDLTRFLPDNRSASSPTAANGDT